MSRPPFEVADVIRTAGNSFRQRYSAALTWPQRKVLDAILRCRTAALGGHRDACVSCGHQAISYNSCRNRHCPKCQTGAREQWLAKRQLELLPIDYYHLVFSVPHTLVPLMWQNKRQLFSLLFEASAATLLDVAADPKHLGAQPGFLSILHTWGQTLNAHPHIHCVVPGGGLAPGPRALDRFPFHLPSAGQGAQPRLPRQVRRRTAKRSLPAISCASSASACLFMRRSTSPSSCVRFIGKTGWCMPSRPSAAPSMCCITWRATRIASPSPTIACSRSQLLRSASAGRTMLTAASNAP